MNIENAKNIIKQAAFKAAPCTIGTAIGVKVYSSLEKSGFPDEFSIPIGIGAAVGTADVVSTTMVQIEADRLEKKLRSR